MIVEKLADELKTEFALQGGGPGSWLAVARRAVELLGDRPVATREEVDPDARAKALAWKFYQIMTPDTYRTKSEMWDSLGHTLCKGWRAVAAMEKGNE